MRPKPINDKAKLLGRNGDLKGQVSLLAHVICDLGNAAKFLILTPNSSRQVSRLSYFEICKYVKVGSGLQIDVLPIEFHYRVLIQILVPFRFVAQRRLSNLNQAHSNI